MNRSASIYLDNAATTRVSRDVSAVVVECMEEEYGNPSSAHHLGISAERRTKQARGQMLAAIGDPDGALGDVVWTSGGTESDALGVIGPARARQGSPRGGESGHLVYSAIEHSAVRDSIAQLGRAGWDATEVAVDPRGVVSPDELAAAVNERTRVVALMLVNNEIGTIQPVAEAARAARAKNPELHVHCDAVQALGKIPIDVGELGADSIAFSAHKIHGPKGAGAVWLRKGCKVAALWGGGGHQAGLRSGTLNVPGIAGMGAAVVLASAERGEHAARWAGFADLLRGAARRAGCRFRENGEGAPRAPHVLSLAFADVPAEPLLHVLESRGVLVSAGSACSERDRRPSHVLESIGLPPEYGTVRLSFGRETTAADVERAAGILVDALKSLC